MDTDCPKNGKSPAHYLYAKSSGFSSYYTYPILVRVPAPTTIAEPKICLRYALQRQCRLNWQIAAATQTPNFNAWRPLQLPTRFKRIVQAIPKQMTASLQPIASCPEVRAVQVRKSCFVAATGLIRRKTYRHAIRFHSGDRFRFINLRPGFWEKEEVFCKKLSDKLFVWNVFVRITISHIATKFSLVCSILSQS